MDRPFDIEPIQIVYIIALVLGVSFLLALLLMGYVIWRVKRIRLPEDADLITTLRATPLVVVVLLDLLDFSLDFLSAPFAWVLLGRLGLQKLRGVTVVESLIPFTQALPTMTLAWVLARLVRQERLPKF